MNTQNIDINEELGQRTIPIANRDNSETLFSLEGLTKVFRSDNVETTALNDINIEIKCGEFVAVMGPSGCGKSTLLNIIGMLDNPTSGSFLFNGEDVAGYGENRGNVAESIGMHESTISRVTTNKYMHTPRGIFEFKYFFSSHLSTVDGNDQSSTAVRAKIRKLIGAENPAKPLSDSKIAALLAGEGINVARRTIAKYRESMQITSSSERKVRKPRK